MTPVANERHLLGRFHRVAGRYIHGVISVPKVLRKEDRVVYHEIQVLLSESAFVTVRKTHPSGEVFEPTILLDMYPDMTGNSTGEMFYRLMEDVTRSYSNLLYDLMDEIDELESAIGIASTDRIHERYSGLRRDLLFARRQLAPLMDAMKSIDDERLDIDDRIFPQEIEGLMRDVRDDLDRVGQSIPLVTDLLSGVRDYHQGVISQRQNEKMEKLTIIASLLLVPTLIVGVYGQNFDRMPELHWAGGYEWSWILIVGTTILQLLFFWRLGWLGKKRSTPEKGADIGSVLEEEDE